MKNKLLKNYYKNKLSPAYRTNRDELFKNNLFNKYFVDKNMRWLLSQVLSFS